MDTRMPVEQASGDDQVLHALGGSHNNWEAVINYPRLPISTSRGGQAWIMDD